MRSLFRFLPSRPWSLRAWKTWKSYVHWRLETYGIYYPDGHFNKQAFGQLLKQSGSYYRWLKEIDKLK